MRLNWENVMYMEFVHGNILLNSKFYMFSFVYQPQSLKEIRPFKFLQEHLVKLKDLQY